jgi:hypothetical protein
MMPLLLMQVICQLFSQHLTKLKEMRRSRPLPKDWRAVYPLLREAEWPVHVLMSEGARRLLAGDPLDLHAVPFEPEPPATFQPPFPSSAVAMHQRIEATARFNARPESYVRRHAARIGTRGAESESDESGPASPNPNPTTNFSLGMFPPAPGSADRLGAARSKPDPPTSTRSAHLRG